MWDANVRGRTAGRAAAGLTCVLGPPRSRASSETGIAREAQSTSASPSREMHYARTPTAGGAGREPARKLSRKATVELDIAIGRRRTHLATRSALDLPRRSPVQADTLRHRSGRSGRRSPVTSDARSGVGALCCHSSSIDSSKAKATVSARVLAWVLAWRSYARWFTRTRAQSWRRAQVKGSAPPLPFVCRCCCRARRHCRRPRCR